MTTAVTPPAVGSRIGAIASIVSAVNILLFAILGFGLAAVNVVSVIVPVPAGYFIGFAAIQLALVLVTWPQANRSIPPALTRAPGFSLSSRMLTTLATIGAIGLYGFANRYDPFGTAFGPYAVAGWICLAAVLLGYLRGQFDPPAVTLLSPLLTRVPDPSRSARVLGTVSFIAFVAMLVFCVALIPVEQLISLVRHGSLRAIREDPLPVPVPAVLFWVQPVVLAVVFIASFWKSNRWIPDGKFAGPRTVTPLLISLFAVTCLLAPLPALLYVNPLDEGTWQYYGGEALLFLIFASGAIGGRWFGYAAPTKPGKRIRGQLPVVDVGQLPQVAIAPTPGWLVLPYKFPADGYPNATAWATGMLPRIGAEVGTGTDEQKHAFARSLVTLINSRLKRNMGTLVLRLEEWEGAFLVAGLASDLSQPWRGMPVHALDEQLARDDAFSKVDPSASAAPLTGFTTASGLEGHRRLAADRVDYWVTVEGGWAHLSCQDDPERIAEALHDLDALSLAIHLSDRVVGRGRKPVE
ncbi:MAG TPA: hypothetical protein VGM70_10410 [Pseudolysinimonas sp.]|jgi:hypothetical protein